MEAVQVAERATETFSLTDCWFCGLPVWLDHGRLFLADLSHETPMPPDCWFCSHMDKVSREPVWIQERGHWPGSTPSHLIGISRGRTHLVDFAKQFKVSLKPGQKRSISTSPARTI